MTDNSGERKVWQCKYCKRRVSRYQTICSACYAKLPLVRRIIAIGKIIRERERSGGDNSGLAD